MKFNVSKARAYYYDCFGDKLSNGAIEIARVITVDEFNYRQPGCDEETGEHIESPFSAGEWDAIDYSL